MKQQPLFAVSSVLSTALLLLAGCSMAPMQNAGTGSGWETKVCKGMIVDESGYNATGTKVQLITAEYDPERDGRVPDSLTDTIGEDGYYVFRNVGYGYYNIQAQYPGMGTRLLISGVRLAQDTVKVPAGILRATGAIKIMLSGNADTISGYVYVPGTTFSGHVRGGAANIDSVPAGYIPSVRYADARDSTRDHVIKTGFSVAPGAFIAIMDTTGWKFSRRMILNTSASGAGVDGTVTNFPVLVRLSGGVFNFSEARRDGSDLRFTKADDTPLPYEIEKWDSAMSTAAVWVGVDTVYGDNSSQCIVMRWGGPNSRATNGNTVFETSAGFQGVWHMGQKGGGAALDATSNRYIGTPFNMGDSSAVSGMIGTAQEFDGISQYIVLAGTANSTLNLLQNGYYTLSAWVFVDTLIPMAGDVFISKGDMQYNLEVDRDESHWHMSEWQDKTGLERIGVPAAAKTWTYVAGVRQGSAMKLYVNGVLASDSIFINPNTLSRTTAYDVTIGKIANEASRFMDGKLDELRIQNRSCSADWIRLCYMNQRPVDKLVVFNR